MNDVSDSLALFRQLKASVRGSEKYLLVGIDVAKNKHHAFFGTPKALDQFDFTESPVNEMQIRHLHGGSFLSDHTNVIMVGGTGTGKTHLAIAIARQNIRNGRKVRFFNVLDLVNQLEQEKLSNKGNKWGHDCKVANLELP